MNILLIAHERNLGGASKSLVTLACELRDRGHDISVILPMRSGQVYKKLQQCGIKVKKIFFGWWMCPIEWNVIFKLGFRILHSMEWIAVSRIIAYAQKNNIQIIHSNSSTIDVGALAANKAGIPHIWHFREFGDLDYNLEFMLGREHSCETINQISDAMVFISHNLYQYYKEDLKEEKCHVIYNGISSNYLFAKYENEIINKNKNITFLISGNLHRNKKQNIAIEAALILKNRGYDNFSLIVAGAPSNMADSHMFERELKEQAKGLMPEQIQFTGFVNDISGLRRKTDVELVCSSREAFGRVTVEAMMCSNPVIASNTGANPELIAEGQNGFLFKEGDADSLADMMEKFLNDPRLVQELGTNAYCYAKDNFSSSRNTANIEELYKSISDQYEERKKEDVK